MGLGPPCTSLERMAPHGFGVRLVPVLAEGSPALPALPACICVCQGSTKGWAELGALGGLSRSKCNDTAPRRG